MVSLSVPHRRVLDSMSREFTGRDLFGSKDAMSSLCLDVSRLNQGLVIPPDVLFKVSLPGERGQKHDKSIM